MIGSVKATGSLPDLQNEPLDWLPVDIAAEAVLQVGSINSATRARVEEEEVPVYHILNPHQTPTWSDLLLWLRNLYPDFQILQAKEWVENLETLTGEEAEHPARKLVGLWRNAYCGDSRSSACEGGEVEEKRGTLFETAKTAAAVPAIRDVQPLDKALFGKIWGWIDGGMLEGWEAA